MPKKTPKSADGPRKGVRVKKGAKIRPEVLKEAFLAAYANGGTIGEACRVVAKMNGGTFRRATVGDWRKNDPAFRAAMKDAAKDATDSMIAEARRRAMHRGRGRSDTLLMFCIKAKDRRYRDGKTPEKTAEQLAAQDAANATIRQPPTDPAEVHAWFLGSLETILKVSPVIATKVRGMAEAALVSPSAPIPHPESTK